MVIANSQGHNMPLRSMEYVRSKLTSKDLFKNLIQCLLRNTNWEHEFKGLKDDKQKQECFNYVQREQLQILEIIFSLSLELEPKIEHLEQLLGYLVKTEFQGEMCSRMRIHHLSDTGVVNQSKITDMGVLTFLAMLRVDLMA
jgi:hypothetical protein